MDKVDVIEDAMYELGSSTRESQEFTAHFNPVLVPFHLSQHRVWYIMVPYLPDHSKKVTTPSKIITIRKVLIQSYLISALGPGDGPFVSLRQWDQTRRSLLRAMPLPVLEVLGTM